MTVTTQAIPAYADTPFCGTTSHASDLHLRRPTTPTRAHQTPHPAAARLIRVPRQLHDAGVSALAIALFTVLEARHRPGSVAVTLPQSQLMTALGRRGHRPDRVTAATTELLDAGVLRTSRARTDSETTYELIVRGGQGVRWDVVSMRLLAAMAAGECTPVELVTALHVDQALGRAGWTADTPEEFAERMGCTGRSIRRHLDRLAAVGEIVITRAGRGVMLSRPAAHLPTSGTPPSPRPASAPEPPPAGRHSHPEDPPAAPDAETGRRTHPAPVDNFTDPNCSDAFSDKNAGSARTKMRGLTGSAPEGLAPEDNNHSPSRSARSVSNARATATSGRQRPKRGKTSSSGIHLVRRHDVADLIRQLPRIWWTGSATRWRPGLATLLGRHLDAGVSAQLLIEAVSWYADPESHRGHLRDAAAHGITTMLRDIAQRAACRRCGSAHVIDDSGLCRTHGGTIHPATGCDQVEGPVCRRCGSTRGVQNDYCWRHQPGCVLKDTRGVEMTDLEIRARTWASCQTPHEEVRRADPQLAAWLDHVGWARLTETGAGEPGQDASDIGGQPAAHASPTAHSQASLTQSADGEVDELPAGEGLNGTVRRPTANVLTDGVDDGATLIDTRSPEHLLGATPVGCSPVPVREASSVDAGRNSAPSGCQERHGSRVQRGQREPGSGAANPTRQGKGSEGLCARRARELHRHPAERLDELLQVAVLLIDESHRWSSSRGPP